MISNHLIAISLAFVIDKIVGDPEHLPHPVRWVGSVIMKAEQGLYNFKNKKMSGTIMVLLVLVLFLSLTIAITVISYKINLLFGILIESIIISATIAQKSLKEAALQVYCPLKENNLIEARHKLSYIVGRDTENLTESEITRATVETVAENICDGITAPLFWALIGGAPFAVAYRVINTCDSMVGYKNDRYINYGWASARLDDLANFIPSRLTCLIILIANKSAYCNLKSAFKITIEDARKHQSPNSGWGEAPVAVLLGVQLGGRNSYRGLTSVRAKMGRDLRPLQAKHIKKTIKIMERTSFIFLIVLILGGCFFEVTYTWSKSAIFV